MKVLILEDSQDQCLLISKALEKKFKDIEIICEDRAEYAFTSIPTFRPDVIISDHEFPTSTCATIMKQLKKFKGLVVLYSENDIKDVISTVISCGKSDFPSHFRIVQKPDLEKLIENID